MGKDVKFMAGKTIYFTEKELQLLITYLGEGNVGFDGHENEEELFELLDSIRKKLYK